MTAAITLTGLIVASATLAAILWSIRMPSRRIWPPRSYDDVVTPLQVWGPTLVLAGAIVWLGLLGWGELGLPRWLRWGIGGPLIVLSNVAVWSEVAWFGLRQTGGAEGPLRTDGLYRWSRNPQYVADIVMVLGWIILSASTLAMVVGTAAIAILAAAPFAEETWMAERHGQDWRNYVTATPRYI